MKEAAKATRLGEVVQDKDDLVTVDTIAALHKKIITGTSNYR